MNKDSPSNYRVALDSNFRDVNGNALYPDFDLTPLNQEAELSWNYVDLGEVVRGNALLDYDALVLLLPRFTGESVPSDGKLSLVARFGVGYDTVDQKVCSENGIVLTSTPDAVRRPLEASPERCSGWLQSTECSTSHMIHLGIGKSIRILM